MSNDDENVNACKGAVIAEGDNSQEKRANGGIKSQKVLVYPFEFHTCDQGFSPVSVFKLMLATVALCQQSTEWH